LLVVFAYDAWVAFRAADNVTPFPDLAKLAGAARGGARVNVV